MSPINSISSRVSLMNRFNKRQFDVTNETDLEEYRYFLANAKWRNATCPFEVEWPYLTIPQMINEKIAEHYLFNIVK